MSATNQSSEINSSENQLQIFWPIVYISGLIGLMLSWFVLSGDAEGKINLFYLLLVYLLLPILSIIASMTSLFFGKGFNFARLMTLVPIWSFKQQSVMRKVSQLNVDKYWLLLQSQVAAIAFSIASLLVFFTLLLSTDLNFIWRSTVLEATDIYPWLKAVATPWEFWSAAQPDIQLLELTQDSRLSQSNNEFKGHGAWWKFILATQFCYSLILRMILMAVTKWRLAILLGNDVEIIIQTNINQNPKMKIQPEINYSVAHDLTEDLEILNWDNVPSEVIQDYATKSNLPIDTQRIKTIEQLKRGKHLVIVKSWEAPLGEFEDYLEHTAGYILPIDWSEQRIVTLKDNHFSEWQRLASKFESWQLLVPAIYMPIENKDGKQS